jgi:predicted transposase/invertase (TIGR01784 family)
VRKPLNAQEEATFQAEIDKPELRQQEAIMQVTTSWEEKGIEKGIERGRQEERQAIALNLLRQGLPKEAIAQATGLTMAQVQRLQAQMD